MRGATDFAAAASFAVFELFHCSTSLAVRVILFVALTFGQIASTWRFTNWKIISRRIASAPESPNKRWIIFWVPTEELELLAMSISNEHPVSRPHSPAKRYFIRRYVSFSPAYT